MNEWTQTFVGREAELDRLRNAWRRTVSGFPQVVAVVAETGYGKTRLAQEFFTWLSTEVDRIGHLGYWPDRLVRAADNLLVNPDPADCASSDMPFLWWGLRLADPGSRNETVTSALSGASDPLRAHLHAYEKRLEAAAIRRRQAVGGSLNVTDVALNVASMVPGLGTIFGLVGLGKSVVQGSLEAVRLEAEIRSLQGHSDQRTAAERRRLDLADVVVNDLRTIAHAPPDGMPTVPLALLIDDAQWARQDQTLCAFVSRLLEAAGRERWPLIVVVTCWEQEWRRRDDRGVSALFEAPGVETETLVLANASGLDEVVRAALPGLTAAQTTSIVDRADGNPRFLDEIIQRLMRARRLFVDLDLRGPLTAKGEELVEAQDFEDVVMDRMQASPSHVQYALSLASLQGIRFSALIVRATASRLKLKGTDAGLAEADAPYGFVRSAAAASEFRARAYQRVARANLPNLADETAAKSALREVLAAVSVPEGATATEEEEAYEAQLALLDGSDPEQRTRGLAALAALVRVAHRRFDTRTEQKLVLRWSDEWARALGSTAPVTDLIDVIDALLRNDELERAAAVAVTAVSTMDRLVGSDPDPVMQREQVLALERAGDVAVRRYEMQEALDLYRRGLSVAEAMLAADPSADCVRVVTVMQSKVGDSIEVLNGVGAALPFFREAAQLADRLADDEDESEQKKAAACSRLGTALFRIGRNDEALPMLLRARAYYENRLGKQPGPDRQRDVGIILQKLARVNIELGNLEEALLLADSSVLLATSVAEHSPTVQLLEDRRFSLKALGTAQQRAQGYAAALPAMEEALGISEELVRCDDNERHSRMLSEDLNDVAGTMRVLHGAAHAIPMLERSVKISARPDVRRDAQGRRCFELALWKLADVYLEVGRPADAVAALQRVPGLLHVTRDHGGGISERQSLSTILELLVRSLRAAGDPAAAADPQRRLVEVREEIAVERPTVACRYDLATALVQHGDYVAAGGMSVEALEIFERAEAVNLDLLGEDTSDVWRNQGVICERIGDLLRVSSPARALDSFVRSLEAFERVARAAPSIAARSDLALALHKLASAQASIDQRAEAGSTLRRLADVRGELAAGGDVEALALQIGALGRALEFEEDDAAVVALVLEIQGMARGLAEERPNARSFIILDHTLYAAWRLELHRWKLASAVLKYLACFRARLRVRAKLKAFGWSRQKRDAALRAIRAGENLILPDDTPPASDLPTKSASTPRPTKGIEGTVESRPVDEWLDDASADAVTEPTEVVAPASRNSPCPCGSGRRFKNCHGRIA